MVDAMARKMENPVRPGEERMQNLIAVRSLTKRHVELPVFPQVRSTHINFGFSALPKAARDRPLEIDAEDLERFDHPLDWSAGLHAARKDIKAIGDDHDLLASDIA